MLSQYIYIYSVCYPNMMVPYDVIFPIYYVVPKKNMLSRYDGSLLYDYYNTM